METDSKIMTFEGPDLVSISEPHRGLNHEKTLIEGQEPHMSCLVSLPFYPSHGDVVLGLTFMSLIIARPIMD